MQVKSVRNRRPHGTRSLFGVAVATVAAVGMLAAAPVVAAAPTPAATATAFQVALTGSVGTPAAVFASANATLAAVTAPPDQTASVASIAAQLGATTAFAADGAAQSSATSSATQNRGTSAVNALTAALLGQPITATTLSGTATCPAGGPPTAATVVAGLSVFGTAITAQLNATTTATAAVTVPGITGATLNASVRTRIEQVTATTATATALSITFTLTGTVAGVPVTLDLGTLTAGRATCNLPTVVAPTATGLTPPQGPTTGGTTVTVTGSGFQPGKTTVTIGGVTVPASAVTVTSPTSLTFTTPAHPAGPVTVAVTTPNGTSGTLPFTFVDDATNPSPTTESGSSSPGSPAIETVTATVIDQNGQTTQYPLPSGGDAGRGGGSSTLAIIGSLIGLLMLAGGLTMRIRQRRMPVLPGRAH